MDGTEQQQLLTIDDLAKLTGTTPDTIYAMRYRGRGPRALKVGRGLRWTREEVDRWLAEEQQRDATQLRSRATSRKTAAKKVTGRRR